MEPRDAATVMLVRDAPDLHVFMLRRSLRSTFVAGAYVFPGGAVDDGDAAPELLARCHGIAGEAADGMLGQPAALRYWVAAIRESFEEAGVLLARAAGTREPVDVDEPGVAARLDADRRSLLAGEREFVDIVRAHDSVLDAGALLPTARWITPVGGPRRYDTWFFVAAAPEGHVYEHDDDETVASVWTRPADALARARANEIDLIYPTFRALQVLAGFERSADLLGALARAWRDDPQPMREVAPDQGWMLHLGGVPSEASGSEELEADALDHATFTVSRPGGR